MNNENLMHPEMQKPVHIPRYRPPGWDDLVNDLIRISREEAQKAGVNTRDEQDRMIGENFADAMLEGLRNINGAPATVIRNRVHLVIRDKKNNIHLVGTQLTYAGDLGYQGPGVLSFIPADPGTVSYIKDPGGKN